MVKTLTGEGIGVVWSTAYLDEAERCDTVLLLDQGRLLFDGEPAALTARVAGRVFRIRGLGHERRAARAPLLDQPGVIDGGIPGRHVRVVDTAPPELPGKPPLPHGQATRTP